MRQVIHKLFFAWEFDKEEKWLNEMAAKGFALISVGFLRYEFEDCVPGEYKYCIELLEDVKRAVNEKYIGFLEETGVEHVGKFGRWAYFRKKTPEPFSLFSDNTSRINYLNRIIRFIACITVLNLFVGIYNITLCFAWGSIVNALGFINILLGFVGTFGLVRLCRQRKRLKAERNIFE